MFCPCRKQLLLDRVYGKVDRSGTHLQEGGTSVGSEQTKLNTRRGAQNEITIALGATGEMFASRVMGERQTLQTRLARLDDVGRCALASTPSMVKPSLEIVASGKGWNVYLSFSVEGAKVPPHWDRDIVRKSVSCRI